MGSRVTLIFPNQSTLKLSKVSQHTTIQSTPTLFPQPAPPKRMNPLHCHTVPQVVHLFPGLQCIWSRISMLELSGFTVVNKVYQMPMHPCTQALIHGWKYTSNSYIQPTMVVVLQQFVSSFPRKKKERARREN
jgi:hypothetical protein